MRVSSNASTSIAISVLISGHCVAVHWMTLINAFLCAVLCCTNDLISPFLSLQGSKS